MCVIILCVVVIQSIRPYSDVMSTFFVAITVTFNQSMYSFTEDDGPAQPVLVLSNPSSTDITVQVTDIGNTATSE